MDTWMINCQSLSSFGLSKSDQKQRCAILFNGEQARNCRCPASCCKQDCACKHWGLVIASSIGEAPTIAGKCTHQYWLRRGYGDPLSSRNVSCRLLLYHYKCGTHFFSTQVNNITESTSHPTNMGVQKQHVSPFSRHNVP